MERTNFATKSPFEPLRGYSRAVQLGDSLFISGTTATLSSGEVVAPGEAYAQTRFVISKIRKVLAAAGFTIHDIVRTRMFVTNIGRWEEYARAHREAFEIVRPASSIVQVAKLVDPRLMLEMEVDAMRGGQSVKNIEIPELSESNNS